MTEPRIEPLSSRHWDAEILDAIAPMTPPPGSAAAQRRSDSGRAVVNALKVLVRHPALMKAFSQFNRHLLYESTITERDRELVVLRVALRCGSAYEWGQHVEMSRGVGFTDDDIARVIEGPDAEGWSPRDATFLNTVDELIDGHTISDTTWAALTEFTTEHERMDLVFLVGGYVTLAAAFNAFGIAPDDGLPGLP